MRQIAVKLDLEKAYDLLDWQFVKCTLKQFGFHATWIERVMECISSSYFSILLNGTPQGFYFFYFYPTRGIRQGDPLTPYILILCMEPLIRHFNFPAERT